MSCLPVLVGFGGINSAGRSSFYHGYRRLVIDCLVPKDTIDVYCGLATMMGYVTSAHGKYYNNDNAEYSPEKVVETFGSSILKGTLVRRISPDLYDMDRVYWNRKVVAHPVENSVIRMQCAKKMIPSHIPPHWEIQEVNGDSSKIEICIKGPIEFLAEDYKKFLVQTGGQIPAGLDIGAIYNSKSHPRGLQLTVYGASDAIYSMGIEWEKIKSIVPPDQIGVYSCSAMGQLDAFGYGGLLQAPALGNRTSSKQLALGLCEMPADFINAYIIGNVGYTSANIGACATTLYNLDLAIKDIRSGKRRVALVGNSEAPLVPEIIEGYRVMGALAEDEHLLELDRDKGLTEPDYTRSCRPFGNNCGFTLAESAQYFILFDDKLALELGAQIFGSIGDMFINADGYKKSIASPGFGNYICLAKAVASARAMFGIESVRQRSFIHAHGTGTPQNRSTESHGLNEIAKAFGIEKWPVSAIKCYVGHSLGPASGDQIIAALGTWKYGLIPGIFTLDSVAEDVYNSNLLFSKDHLAIDPDAMDVAFINAKGFGGNNATGVIISPQKTIKMLKYKYGDKAISEHQKKCEKSIAKAEEYNQKAIQGTMQPIYDFGMGVLSGDDLNITDHAMTIPGFGEKIDLNFPSPYPDMTQQGD